MYNCYSFVVCAVFEQWPEGKYALPRPVYDCPSKSLQNWTAGMAKIHLRPRQDNTPASSWSTIFHHLGTNQPNEFIMATCASGRDESAASAPTEKNEKNRAAWPKGSYCIYKTGSDCPNGTCNTLRFYNYVLKLVRFLFTHIVIITKGSIRNLDKS